LSTGSAAASSPATSASQPPGGGGGNPNAANALKEFMKDPYKNDALWNQDSPPRHSLKTAEDKKNEFFDDMEEVGKKINRTEERGRPLKKEDPQADVEMDLSTLTFQVGNNNNDKNQKIKPRGEFSFLPIEESKQQQQQQFLVSSEDDSLASASFINNKIRSNSALSTSSLDTTSSAISANKKVAMFTRRKSVMKSAGFKKSDSPNNISSASSAAVAALVKPTAVSSVGRATEEDTNNIASFLQDEDEEDEEKEKEEEMTSKKAPLVSSSSLSLLWNNNNNNNNEEEKNQPIISSPPPPPPPPSLPLSSTATVTPTVVSQADSSASSFVNPLFALMNQKRSAAAASSVPPPPSLPSQTTAQSAVVPPPPPPPSLPTSAVAATAAKPPMISAPLAVSQPLSSSSSSTAVVNPLMALQSQKQSLPPPPPAAPLPSSVPATVAPKQTTFLSIDTEFGDKKSLKTPLKEEKVEKDDEDEPENNFAFSRKKQKKVDYYTPEKYSSSASSMKPTTPINQNKNKISLSSTSFSPTPHSMVKSPVKSTTLTINNNYNSPKNKLPSSSLSSSQPPLPVSPIPSSTHVVPSSSSASPYSPSALMQHNDISYIERDESLYFLKLPQQEFRSAFQQKLQLLFSTLQLTPEQVKEFVGQNQEKLRAVEEREQREWKQKKEEEMEKVKQKEIEKQRQQSQQRRGGTKVVKGKGKDTKLQKQTIEEEQVQEENDEKNDPFFEDFIEKHQLEQSLQHPEDQENVHHELHAYEKIPLHLFVNHEKEDEDTDTDKDDDDHEDHYHRSHQNKDDNPYQQLLKEKQGLLESLNYLHVYYLHSKEKILFRQFESLKLIITTGQEQLQQLMKERNYYSSLYQTYQEEVVQKNNELFSKEQQAIFQRINSLKTLFLEKEYQIYSLVLLLKKKNMDLLQLQKQFHFSERMNAFNQEELAAVLNTEGEEEGDDMNKQETHLHYQREDLSRNENINFHRQQRVMASQRRKESISMELQRIKRELSWKKQQMMSSRDSMDEIVDLRSKRSTRDEWDDHNNNNEGGRVTLIDLDNQEVEVTDEKLVFLGRIDDYNSSEDEDNDNEDLTSSGENHHRSRVIPSKKETRVNYSSNSSLTSSSHYR
jgi:hypothetical protein